MDLGYSSSKFTWNKHYANDCQFGRDWIEFFALMIGSISLQVQRLSILHALHPIIFLYGLFQMVLIPYL